MTFNFHVLPDFISSNSLSDENYENISEVMFNGFQWSHPDLPKELQCHT